MVLALFSRQQRRFVRGLGTLSPIGADIAIARTTVGCPALVGAWRPRIVLPADFEQRYSGDERVLILAHERNHRVRGDAQINALAALMRSVFWFNPLIHFAAPRLRFDQELACDANVLARFPKARRNYADAMLKTQLAGMGLPIGCYWQATHPLKERIAMLKQPLPGRVRGALGMALATALIAGGTYVAWAAQPARHVVTSSGATTTSASYKKLSPPNYPPAAVAQNIGGVVYVDVDVRADGTVASSRVRRIEPPGATILGQAALDAVNSWQFDPATDNGIAVAGHALVPLQFSIEGANANQQASPASVPPADALDMITVNARAPKTAAQNPASYKRLQAIGFPAAEAKTGQGGVVLVKAHIGSDGSVESTAVQPGPGNTTDLPELKQAALKGVKSWSFEPATMNGKAMASDAIVPIKFVTQANANEAVVGGTLDAIEIRPQSPAKG